MSLLKIAPENHDRTKLIGGSDVAGILGISPWRTPLDVYLDKVQPRADQPDQNKARLFARGKRMEPYVIDLLAEEAGLQIVGRGNRYIDPEHGFLAAEIDAETSAGDNVEIKTVSPFKAKEWGEQQSDEVPLHYAAQAMHGLMVTGRGRCIFGVLIGADDFRIYEVRRDEPTIAGIRAKEVEFWERVQRLDPPEPTTATDVMRLYGQGDDAVAIEADDQAETEWLRLKSITEDLKRLGDQADQLKESLQVRMGNATHLTLRGAVIATWKGQQARRFDSTAFKAAHPDLHEQFVKVSQSRVFRLK
ncbi:hypothetical protein GCM10009097_55900 [Pigmentiphaga daeguensis]|uniref:YqaJ viral recombinase domain-containing protein n=2 Tax=Pigmentiphaga daeguensis TaxID=414049 RepID=A0ABN1D1P5_9BURK